MSAPKARFALNTTEALNFQAIPGWVRAAAATLLAAGHQAYLVGGAVRDLLWGGAPQDWDLATDARPDRVEAIFCHTVPTGKAYGTITVLAEGGSLEITTFREDLGYSDGRRPDAIRFGTEIAQDLLRRDFTINALAYDFASSEMVDPSGGYADLRRRLLRAVGDPSVRFREDGLRMFRFYRFLATLELHPERRTAAAIRPEWAKPVSLERIRDEFSKLLLGARVRPGLVGLRRSGLLALFLPELEDTDLEQGRYHRHTLWEHLLRATDTIQPQLELRLAALLHDIAKPATRFENESGVHFYGHDQRGAEMTAAILERLRYPGRTVETVTKLIRWHMFLVQPQTGDAAIRRLIAKVGPEQVRNLLELRRADIVATGRIDPQVWEYWRQMAGRILEILEEPAVKEERRLAVTGHDLMSRFGLKPGPLIGRVLGALQEAVWEEPDRNERDILLRLAEEFLNEKGEAGMD
jgi:putative nucleotidyltransferase with HDIG domain